jgi:hypothetical protein
MEKPNYRLVLRTHKSGQYRFHKTAKALVGLAVPLPLLGRADEVIK